MVIRNWCHKSVTTATLLRCTLTNKIILGLSIPGHYNEVALLMRYPLSEISLYFQLPNLAWAIIIILLVSCHLVN